MKVRLAMTVCGGLLAVGLPSAGSAQDAVESAQILSTVGQSQVSAGHSLAKSISGSMNAVTAALGTRYHARGSRQHARPGSRARARHARRYSGAIPANVDALEGTDAPTYTLGNGTTIEVSGGLTPDSQTTCEKNCPGSSNP